MVMPNQQYANQYGAPQQPYQPQPQPVPLQYGQPPSVVSGPPEVKWSGLQTGGGFKSPLGRFMGLLAGHVYDTQAKFGMRVVLKFVQVQVMETTAPWPWPEAEVSVKYSDSEGSAWGKLVKSAKDLGLAIQAQSFDEAMKDLTGKFYEMVHTPNESFGEDKDGKPMLGDVWRFARVLQPMAAQPQMQQQYAPVQQQMAPAPVGMQPQAQVQVVQQAQPVVTGGLDPNDSAPIRAKKLLNGKNLASFLGVALTDPVIKAPQNAAFINTIFDQSFIAGLKASGQAREENGVFIVS
jgi:hypothetical protein